MTQITLPKLSQTGTNEWADVEDNDKAIRDVVNGNLDTGNLAASAGVTDAQLASPNSGLYKVLFDASGFLSNSTAAGTYLLGSAVDTDSNMFKSGTAGTVGGGVTTKSAPAVLRLVASNYNIAGKTEVLAVEASVAANATAPSINFTFGLYPVTVGGGTNTIVYTAGTVVSGSTVAINAPSASTVNTAAAAENITMPSDGHYVLGVVTSGTLANNAVVSCHAHLKIRST